MIRCLLVVLLLVGLVRAQELSVEDLTEQVERQTERVRDGRVSAEDRESAVLERVESLRQLVVGFPEDEAYPEHLANWAEAVLYERLGALESLAVVSHEFGIPTEAHRQAMEQTLGELIERLEAFDVNDDSVDEPLRWRLLMSLATARHAAGFLPAFDPEDTRSDALVDIYRIVDEIDHRPVPAAVRVLEARVRLALGELLTAGELVEPLLEVEPLPMDGTHRLAQLVLADSLRRRGETERADVVVAALSRRLTSAADAAWRLVIADWRYRGRPDLEIYRPLTLAGPGVAWIRAVLAERWLEAYLDASEAEIASLPLWVRTQLLHSAWERLPVHPVEALAFSSSVMLGDSERERLVWVGRLARMLAQSTDLLHDARQEAERIAVLAEFARSDRRPEDAVAAAEDLLDLAERKRRTAAAVLVREAADLLWPHQSAFVTADEDPLTPLLLESIGRVFAEAPRLLADTPNHVLMVAHYIDRVGVGAQEAVAFYRRVPLEALGYWQAQPLLLVELRRGAKETIDPPVRQRLRRDLLLEMARLDAEGARQLMDEDATIARRDGARTALFRVRLLRAELAAEAGDVASGQRWLQEAVAIDGRPRARLEVAVVQTRFLIERDDIAGALERLNRLPARESVVRRLAIDMLNRVGSRLTPVALLELDPPDASVEVMPTDPAVLGLAERLSGRSVEQIDPADPDPAAQAELYAARLLRAHMLLLRGDAAASATLAGELVEGAFATPEVIELAVVANLRVGTRVSLFNASLMADRVIQGYDAPPFPDRWWRCWLRRLLILERLRVGVAQVPPQVRRLQRINPNLGGPELKPRFIELAQRASTPAASE
ncbi:hypothetical protein [Mucisphaera calidilacus]|uniref:hypothetical protein n=1 Tax=Mucisphaera calidilacus TaxID=2527982 RepID=UPI0011A73F36|nr:hypothetical protein [Mucisphaera calidilacus]